MPALILMQANRENLPATNEMINYFSISGKRQVIIQIKHVNIVIRKSPALGNIFI